MDINEEMSGIFCPVICSVKYQCIYEWNKSSLNEYWAKINEEEPDNTFHCKADFNENKNDENKENQQNQQKIILKPSIIGNNKYIPLGDDTYYYCVQLKENLDETNCCVGWIQLQKINDTYKPINKWIVNIS
eukprot:311249_1